MTTDTPRDREHATLGVPQLTALVMGSMIGAGIFSLPQNMAATAAPGPLLVGWGITGVGMLALAGAFMLLARMAPTPDGGVYGYARDGFGRFLGFLSAWGYWVSAWLGNLSYLVVIFSTLGLFFPVFGEGTTPLSIAGASVLLWLYTWLLLRGVREAASLNTLVTIAKIVPLIAFIVLAALAWKVDVFTADFWGEASGMSLTEQVRGMMLVTVWVFLGIEGATVYSQRAKSRQAIARATVVGFLAVLALLVAVNVLSAGVLSQAETAELQNPSMAGVLEHSVGRWGAWLVGIGMIVSVMGALLAWMLLCAEILSVAARDEAMPRALATLNAQDTPRWAVLLTTVVLQLALFYAMWAGAGYYDIILMAGSMILVPYLLSAGYALMLTARGEQGARLRHVLVSAVAVIYAIWLIYAGGIGYLLATSLFYSLGIPVYLWARKEAGAPLLRGAEWFVAAALLAIGVVAVLGLRAGWLLEI
ncbi:arginine:ornithine antiporter, APA family [Kytococcus aerolatus]|uniref:Arginine:ornithine antiporter, APA family n=1 Tax=Kytococcus aerolatus TaxID=592308 RepID=A0A212U5L1_9MICO|nr:basic amino acid/polyamine antiporter [Kytococcus aerolatus]SNC73440.1 arginine:ornithine antiporter, APA family [Kytococcus aerolatus]